MVQRRFLPMGCVLSALCLWAGSTWGQAQAVITISADPSAYDWVVQEATGRIFSSSPSQDEVVEYDPATGKEVRRFQVGTEPRELIIKRHWLVAGCKKATTLSVIDLKANRVVGSVQLTGNGPYGLFCSQAENPFAYAICNTGSAWWDGEIFQVDLEKREVRKHVRVQGWGQSNPLHVAMSRDGKWIVPDARGAHSPSGADLMRVDEQECTFQQVRDHHQSFGQMVAGPHNRYWTFGNQLFPLDITAAVRKFIGSPVAIHPQWDLAASLQLSLPGRETSTGLALETFTEARLLTNVPLGVFRTGAGPGQAGMHDPNLQFDLAGDRVVCGYGPTAFIVDLKKLDVDLQPRLALVGPSAARVVVGSSLRVELSAENPKLAEPVSYEVVAAPDGVELNDATLTWTPGDSALGEHEITVRATSGQASDQLTIQVTVAVPHVELTFLPMRVEVDGQGKFALAWGPKVSDPASPYRPTGDGPMDFAVIDLEQAKIVSQQSLTASIRLMHLDEKYVYLAPATGNLLYRLNRDDANQRTRVFLNGTPTALVPLPKGRLAVMLQVDSRSEIQVFDRETLKPDPEDPAARPLEHVRYTNNMVAETADGTYRLHDRLVDAETGQTRCLVGNAGLPSLVPPAGRQGSIAPLPDAQGSVELWGRVLRGNVLANDRGSTVATINSRVAAISGQHPVLVSLRTEADGRGRRSYLEFRDLVDGAVAHSSLIGGGPPAPNFDHNLRLYLTQNLVIVPEGLRLLLVKFPEDALADLPRPLYLKYPQIPIATADKPLKVQLAADGGKGERRYSLLTEYEGLSLDPATGAVELDLSRMWGIFLAANKSGLAMGRVRDSAASFLASGEAYRQLTGESLPPDKIALTAPLDVTVSDSEGQQDRLCVFVVVQAPKADMQKIVAAQEEANRLAQQQARMESERRRAEQEKQRAQAQTAPAAGGPEPGERIEQLESRIRRLEAALDAVLQKLDKLERQPQ